MKVKSAVLDEIGSSGPYTETQPIRVETLELTQPEYGEVLVEVKAAGLCHSDLSVINGTRPRPVPMALGHEASGIVVNIGEGVDDLEIGDHVVCVFVPSCGHCLPCAEGRPALCEKGANSNEKGSLLNGSFHLHRKNGEEVKHHLGVSAFSEKIVVSRNSVVKIDKNVSFEKAALFGCAVITGVGAVVNTADIKFGSTVAITGLGGVGLSAVLGAVAAGASRIIALDINESKLNKALEFGATDVFNSSEKNVVETIKESTDGGVDYSFETAGVTSALNVAYGITKRGGMTVTTGLPNPEAAFNLHYVTLTAEEKSIHGSYVGSCVPQRDIPRFIELYKQGKLDVDKLHTKTISLNEINFGFDQLERGEALRIIVKM